MKPFHTLAPSLAPALALPLAVLLAAAARAQAETTFRVGTWNLEFLGAPGAQLRNETPPRGEDDYAAIGRKIAGLGVAVLAVQEVNDEATLRKVAAAAGPGWEVLLGTTGTWDDGKTAQRIGFAWDGEAVELLHAEELLQLPRRFENEPIFHRVPVTACFRHKATGADFRLVTVHFKAGQKAVDELKRRGEAKELAAWLDALADDPREDPDVAVLGDFNSTYGADPEALLERTGKRAWLDQRAPAPTILHFADPIDHVVAAARFAELQRGSLEIDGDCDGMPREQWRKVYSDHFPVVVTLAARGDDDPDATFARGPAAQTLPPGKRPAAPAAREERWPPPVGTTVAALTTSGQRIEGRLLRPLPDGPGGWVVLEQEVEIVALPYAQVALLRIASERGASVAGKYTLDIATFRAALLEAIPDGPHRDAAVSSVVEEIELLLDGTARYTMRSGLGDASARSETGTWKLAGGQMTLTISGQDRREKTAVADWSHGAFTVTDEVGGKRMPMTFRKQ